MRVEAERSQGAAVLLWLGLLYTAASLTHFVHNAEFIDAYPNLPDWLSRADVYGSWIVVACVGAAGALLYRAGRRYSGLILLGAYAGLGFDGLLHYTRAPFSAHTLAMNFTIWFEVIAAGVLLAAVVFAGWRMKRAAV